MAVKYIFVWSQLERDSYDVVRPLKAFFFQFLWPQERFLHTNMEELMMGKHSQHHITERF